MSLPAIIWIIIAVMGLGVSLARDGETKVKKESFLQTLIATGINVALLWWGGFFGS